MASDSIVSGAPRDTVTGKPLPEDPRIPVSEAQKPIGAETRADESAAEKMAAAISAPADVIPDELPPKPTTLPRDASGWILDGAPHKGETFKPWSGNPDEEVMPGTDVLYWVRSSNPQPAKGEWTWIVPQQAKILGRMANGDYVGIRFRAIHGGVFAIQQAKPSAVPKLDQFTPRRKYPPELCMLKPGE